MKSVELLVSDNVLVTLEILYQISEQCEAGEVRGRGMSNLEPQYLHNGYRIVLADFMP